MTLSNQFEFDDDLCLNIIQNVAGFFYRCINDEDWTMLNITDGCFEITGYYPYELSQNKIVAFGLLIHPDDQQWLQEKCSYNLEHKIPCNNEYRIICRKGKTKWVREIANGVYDESDALIYIEGFIQDITLEKDNFLLTNAFSSYQDAVNTSSIVSITDLEGKIIYANDFFCEVSQFSKKELLGQTHRVINSNFQPPKFFADLWKTIKKGEIWRGEIKNKAKDGSFYWVDTVIAPVRNKKKEIIQFISIRNLITEQKENEEHLNEKIRELESTHELLKNAYTDLIHIEDAERSRISFEIHDSLMQTLSLFKIHLDLAKINKDFSEFESLISRAVGETREIIYDLYPKDFFQIGFETALNNLFHRTIKKNGISYLIEFDKNVNFDKVDKFIRFNLFRLLQECINNTLKHSQSKDVHLHFTSEVNKLKFIYREKAVEIDVSRLSNEICFISLKRRLNTINGAFEVSYDETDLIFNFEINCK